MIRAGSRAALVGLAAAAVAACSDDSPQSCESLRRQLEALTPRGDPTATWEDISELQTSVAQAMALRDEIADRCG